jgi:cell wall-associated NlpC family hydrolase
VNTPSAFHQEPNSPEPPGADLRALLGVRKVRALLFLFTLLGPVGCTLAGTSAPSDPSPRPSRHTPPERDLPGTAVDEDGLEGPSGTDLPEAVVETALEAIGTPYRWGGSGANGFDCSGLVQYAYGQHGIELPRTSRDQLQRGDPVDTDVKVLEPGDILGFSAGAGGEPMHVGLYVGDAQFIHSSTSGVMISDVTEPYWRRHLLMARRIVR